MTLCIAAACQDRRKPRLVVSSDWKVELNVSSAEIQDKFYWVTEYWIALVAGSSSRALELVNTYRASFKAMHDKKIELTKANIIDVVKNPLRTYKRKLADEYVSLKLGLSYKEFLDKGKGYLPEKQFEEMCRDIAKIKLGCDILLCTFQFGTSYIFRIDRSGECEVCENFAAIGTGTDIAEASLCQREHEGDLSLAQALFHVYEATVLGSKAPGVGKESAISVLSLAEDKGIQMQGIQEAGWRFLERAFKKLSIKQFYRLGFPKRGLERIK